MNAQVLTTSTSASSASAVICIPLCKTLPSMISASTKFFAQPRLIMPTFGGDAVSVIIGYRGRIVAVGLKRGDGVGRGGRGDRLGEGVTVGISAASFGFTGSARRTSGSAVDGAGTGGVVAAMVGVGAAAGVSVVEGAAAVSAGCACGAMILSERVAVAMGELPGAGAGLGLSRCIWSSHFITVNPITRTSTPMINGMNELRPPPLLGAALRRRTLTGRLGSGSGASCKYAYPSVVKLSDVSKASR